jgi:hypothetical protein
VVLYASADDGVNVATLPALLRLVDPATFEPALSLRVNDTEEAVTDWLKVAVGATLGATPVAPDIGDVPVTAGTGLAAGENTGSTQ